MEPKNRKKLGDLLREAGILDDMQLRSALSHQQQWGGRLGAILLKLNMVTEEKLVGFLARQFRLPVMDLSKIEIQPGTLSLIPKNMAMKYQILPLFKDKEEEKEFLAIAMANPGDLGTLDEIRFTARMDPRPVIASDPSLVRAIDYYYNSNGIAPYDPGAKVSSKFTMKDVVQITRDFLSATRAAAGQTREGQNRPSDDLIGVSTLQDDSGEESVIIFKGGEETSFQLDDSPPETPARSAASASAQKPSSDRPLDTDRILRALIEALDEKGIVTKHEIKKFLRPLN